MQPIKIQAVPRTSFNKHRRVSDLLSSQLRHLQHVVAKQGIEIDPELLLEIQTEGGAARYIAAVTRAVRERGLTMNKGTVAAGPRLVSSPAMKTPLDTAAEGLAIAAGAEETDAPGSKP